MPWLSPPPPSVRMSLQQVSQRPEVQVQVVLRQAELARQLLHPLLEEHERLPEALDLLGVGGAGVDPAQRLALHELAQQLDDREHELSEAALHVLRLGV